MADAVHDPQPATPDPFSAKEERSMKPTSVDLWLSSLLVFLVTLAASSFWLPERVATHFGPGGAADAWMSRGTHLTLFAVFGVGFSGFFIILFFAMRYLPPSMMNVSNPQYWRAPENYPRACAFLFQHSFSVATMACLFVTGLNLLLVQANQSKEPHMPAMPVLILAGAFLGGMAWWVVRMIQFFGRTESPRTGAAADV